MRVLVCGGRDFTDWDKLSHELDALHEHPKSEGGRPITLIINGAAPGADRLSLRWAHLHGVPVMQMPALWEFYGAAAGPMRNEWMLRYGQPSLVMAFEGGRGTANMVSQAKAAGVGVVEL